MTYPNSALEDICRQLLDEWSLSPEQIANLAADIPGECKVMADNRAETAWLDRQQSLLESGGPDDSAYRRDMIAAGRGHLVGRSRSAPKPNPGTARHGIRGAVMSASLNPSQISPEAYELRNIRENLRHIGAWIEHWRGDAASRLPCTPSSLDSAEIYVNISLRALDRIEAEQAERAA